MSNRYYYCFGLDSISNAVYFECADSAFAVLVRTASEHHYKRRGKNWGNNLYKNLFLYNKDKKLIYHTRVLCLVDFVDIGGRIE
jgi:hypothetical protein